MSDIFSNITVGCYCINRMTGKKPEKCLCGPEESVIRAYLNGDIKIAMTHEQREWCIGTADWAGEGHYDRKELEAMTDLELASALMNAWYMYAQSQY